MLLGVKKEESIYRERDTLVWTKRAGLSGTCMGHEWMRSEWTELLKEEEECKNKGEAGLLLGMLNINKTILYNLRETKIDKTMAGCTPG